jgi:propanol-preferring alcohol dehydrogenase
LEKLDNEMRAMQLHKHEPIEQKPLREVTVARPEAGADELLIKVNVCGICHTDLHTVEGDIQPPDLPVTPGHQVVGEVIALGEGASGWKLGDRVGIPWLHSADGTCEFCGRGEENLCPNAQFTGFHRDGGYAEYMLADARYALKMPAGIDDVLAAPLLCAGIIGYRSLRLADLQPGERLGLVGFGASAHLAIQVALYWDCEVYVFTRSEGHRKLARKLGAYWVGGSEDDPQNKLDRAIIFAPAGHLVPTILAKLRPAGTLAINAIYMTAIPGIPYDLIYEERTLRSVANLTHQDGVEFLELAEKIPVQAKTVTYPLDRANEALIDLKQSAIDGAGVLKI